MKIMYHCRWIGDDIEEVEVERETEKSVFLKRTERLTGGQCTYRELKEGRYFDTKADALRFHEEKCLYLIANYRTWAEQYEQKLAKLREQ